MTTTSMTATVDQFVGATAYDVSGDKIGKIRKLYVDGRTREPRWALVRRGLFGLSHSIIPLAGSRRNGAAVTLTVAKDAVKDAPSLQVPGGVTFDEAHRLERHYRLDEEQPEAPTPPTEQHSHHSAGLGIAMAAAGIGGTAANITAWSGDQPEAPEATDETEESPRG
jgi:hypothetical protein